MTEAFKINNYVQPLPISKVQCVAFDELTVFSGWGSQNEQNNVHPVLQTANMTVVPFEGKKIETRLRKSFSQPLLLEML